VSWSNVGEDNASGILLKSNIRLKELAQISVNGSPDPLGGQVICFEVPTKTASPQIRVRAGNRDFNFSRFLLREIRSEVFAGVFVVDLLSMAANILTPHLSGTP
jgi:hypothetical protein